MKAEDGEEIKLTILRKPIPLDSLLCENENRNLRKLQSPGKHSKQKYVFKNEISPKKSFKKVHVNKGISKENGEKIGNITFLKTPIPLDNIEWEDEAKETPSSITFDVKTVQGCVRRSNRRRGKYAEYHTWKQNALTIFENSFVYPFTHLGGTYACFICSKPYIDSVSLQNHTINEHTMNELKKELNNRIRDECLKVDVSRLQCKICMQSLSDLSNLKIHLKEHGKAIEPVVQDNLIPFKLGCSTFDCQICGEIFAKLRPLVVHMSKHFNNYNCEICGSLFISLHLLRHHQSIHKSGNYPCDKCDKVFNTAVKRTMHTRGVHFKHFPRRCPICTERFNSNFQRTKHLRIVHNQTSGLYRCDICGREYDLKNHLSIHIRSVHLQERNYECSYCPAKFFAKYTLNRHMVVHTGEKKFKCEICGKAYARKSKLKDHCKTHGDGFCYICGQNCGNEDNVATHINTIHGTFAV